MSHELSIVPHPTLLTSCSVEQLSYLFLLDGPRPGDVRIRM